MRPVFFPHVGTLHRNVVVKDNAFIFWMHMYCTSTYCTVGISQSIYFEDLSHSAQNYICICIHLEHIICFCIWLHTYREWTSILVNVLDLLPSYQIVVNGSTKQQLLKMNNKWKAHMLHTTGSSFKGVYT